MVSSPYGDDFKLRGCSPPRGTNEKLYSIPRSGLLRNFLRAACHAPSGRYALCRAIAKGRARATNPPEALGGGGRHSGRELHREKPSFVFVQVRPATSRPHAVGENVAPNDVPDLSPLCPHSHVGLSWCSCYIRARVVYSSSENMFPFLFKGRNVTSYELGLRLYVRHFQTYAVPLCKLYFF